MGRKENIEYRTEECRMSKEGTLTRVAGVFEVDLRRFHARTRRTGKDAKKYSVWRI
jgi:hypothetical protein